MRRPQWSCLASISRRWWCSLFSTIEKFLAGLSWVLRCWNITCQTWFSDAWKMYLLVHNRLPLQRRSDFRIFLRWDAWALFSLARLLPDEFYRWAFSFSSGLGDWIHRSVFFRAPAFSNDKPIASARWPGRHQRLSCLSRSTVSVLSSHMIYSAAYLVSFMVLSNAYFRRIVPLLTKIHWRDLHIAFDKTRVNSFPTFWFNSVVVRFVVK